MQLFRRNPITGKRLYPYWLAVFIGGNWKGKQGGTNWTPNIYLRTVKYFREGWYQHRSWIDFVFGGIR